MREAFRELDVAVAVALEPIVQRLERWCRGVMRMPEPFQDDAHRQLLTLVNRLHALGSAGLASAEQRAYLARCLELHLVDALVETIEVMRDMALTMSAHERAALCAIAHATVPPCPQAVLVLRTILRRKEEMPDVP